jgi:flagellar biosynthesis protein FlhB
VDPEAALPQCASLSALSRRHPAVLRSTILKRLVFAVAALTLRRRRPTACGSASGFLTRMRMTREEVKRGLQAVRRRPARPRRQKQIRHERARRG